MKLEITTFHVIFLLYYYLIKMFSKIWPSFVFLHFEDLVLFETAYGQSCLFSVFEPGNPD